MPGKTKVRIKPKFYIILTVFLAIVGSVVLLVINMVRDGELTVGEMQLAYPAKAVLLRDETIVSAERYDRVLFDVLEGATVNEGDPIAEVFKWGYQEDTMQTLLNVQKEIYEYQLSLVEDIVNADLDALQAQIKQKQLAIRSAIGGETEGDVLTLEQELKALLTQRSDMLRELVQPDENLTVLYEQENVQLNNLSSWKSDMVNTAGSGVVSFYFDGYEQALDTQKLDMVNADLIAEVIKNGGAVTNVDTTVDRPLYRLVNRAHFYLAFLTDSASPFRLVRGETYQIVVNEEYAAPFTGVALAPVIYDKQVVNLLEVHQDMGDLMNVRLASVVIGKQVNGLRVPLDAIDMQNNIPGILRVAGEDTQWIEVEVLAVDEEEAIIRAANADSRLVEGARYKRPRK